MSQILDKNANRKAIKILELLKFSRKVYANSTDTDQTAHHVHCLPFKSKVHNIQNFRQEH